MKKEALYYLSLLKKKEDELSSHWEHHHTTLNAKEDDLRKANQKKVLELKEIKVQGFLGSVILYNSLFTIILQRVGNRYL